MAQELLPTQKGQNRIEHEGYFYYKNKPQANGFIGYECELRRRGQCSARIRVNGDVVIKGNVGHTHAPIPGRREALQARNSIRHQAAATQDTPQQIIANCVQNLPEGSVFSSSFKVGKI